MPEIALGRYRFKPRPFTTLAAIAFVALTFAAGQWQTGRASQKMEMQARLEAMSVEAPLAMPAALVSGDSLVQRRLTARGSFEGRSYLVDNKVYRGAPGYHVITPFCVEPSAPCVLVNRGWVAAGSRREVLPPVAAPTGPVDLEGIVVLPPSRPYELGHQTGEDVVIQHLVVDRIAARARLTLQPFIVLQTGATTDKMVRDWPRPDTGINTHRAYALQWYVMALVGIILWVSLNLHREKAVENNESRSTGA
jgi:surfeit locus 1 family protein